MYSTYLSTALALAVGLLWTFLELWGGWFLGSFLGFIAFLATWIVIGRRFNRKIQPVLMQARRQAEAGNAAIAKSSMESLLPLANWIPLLKGQLYAQIGVLALGSGKEDEALEYLEKASHRASEAKLFLASMLYRKGEFAKCQRVLDAAKRFNKKDVLLHNLYAFLLRKEGRIDDAIKQLNDLQKKVPENEATIDNLKRIKNGQKMNMKPFGMTWYSLGLEKPPASMARMPPGGRRGFRQPSKKKR